MGLPNLDPQTGYGDIGKKEHEKLEQYEGLKEKLEQMWEAEGNNGSSGDRSTGGCDPQTGRFTPTDSRYNI